MHYCHNIYCKSTRGRKTSHYHTSMMDIRSHGVAWSLPHCANFLFAPQAGCLHACVLAGFGINYMHDRARLVGFTDTSQPWSVKVENKDTERMSLNALSLKQAM